MSSTNHNHQLAAVRLEQYERDNPGETVSREDWYAGYNAAIRGVLAIVQGSVQEVNPCE